MPTLYVHEVPEHIYLRAQKIAASQGRSLSAYVVTILEQAIADEEILKARSEALASIRRNRRKLPADAPDSVEVLRQIRRESF